MGIEERFKDYTFRVNWTSSEPYNPRCDVVEVRLTTKDGQEYMTDFVALDFFRMIFEKNKTTKECANGTYFSRPNMIIVEEISEQNIKATIDDLINLLSIDQYLTKLDY